MTRDLSPAEAAWLRLLVDHGVRLEGDDGPPLTDEDRQRWRRQIPVTRVGDQCGCGTCPSIELVVAGTSGPSARRGIVLSVDMSAWVDPANPAREAIVLLFVDEDRLSYLELAPPGSDTVLHSFPAIHA